MRPYTLQKKHEQLAREKRQELQYRQLRKEYRKTEKPLLVAAYVPQQQEKNFKPKMIYRKNPVAFLPLSDKHDRPNPSAAAAAA